jgi:uncharacterized protein (DUF2249 family)
MVSLETKAVIRRAKLHYAEHLQATLEAEYIGKYVAVEPESGDHFLADSFDAAVEAARQKYPNRLSHTIKIGQPAAFHIGGARV